VVPLHRRDLAVGTLANVLRQAREHYSQISDSSAIETLQPITPVSSEGQLPGAVRRQEARHGFPSGVADCSAARW
jgi:hypothetical protein